MDIFRPATYEELREAIERLEPGIVPAEGPINTWDVTLVTDMSGLFSTNHTFNEDISGWNVINVTDMYSMFGGATSFNGNISGWKV